MEKNRNIQISDQFKKFLIRLFNTGYGIGHNATVEGTFIDLHPDDFDSYHEDIVIGEILGKETSPEEISSAINYPQIFFAVQWVIENVNTECVDHNDLMEVKSYADRCHSAYLKET